MIPRTGSNNYNTCNTESSTNVSATLRLCDENNVNTVKTNDHGQVSRGQQGTLETENDTII